MHAATAGDPNDPLLLLIHGTFGAWLDFREVIAPLADEGFYVAAVDMRGYGLSDKPPSRHGNDALYALGDIDGIITALGHERAVIAGHDTGGAMGWGFAACYPHRTTALISISAAHPHDLRTYLMARPWQLIPMLIRISVGRLPRPLLQRFSSRIPMLWRRELLLNTTRAFHNTPAFEELLDARILAARTPNALRGVILNSRLLTPKIISLPDAAARRASAPVAAPVLAIHPPQSVWTGIDRLARTRTTGPLRTASIPGTKNLPHVENPQGFVEEISRFLRGIDAV
ncbi:alpha/beta fold hydrolase [Corynebacterium aquatimens]|uniref:Pimeloyl-ACP methyl ester carboxylesterase n=1 Tax=Corynebacterium aquatimens TaxID=1190508 RepID=A0A931GXV0_9CORY|nr:alpha/beta hydrolase [Corynebacterium aquatimens]MBG6122534.1 pimeloyl-ACP methyl ester carboxylesterase [Corynebacterium aquatimens]WJY64926.1 4,5:9,10-diseco-3-hydroxy-5,9,17-trioxoandrosta-1(10),2-diene-4-oate hydrolase [Corynebacterium aquatimens]